LDDVTLTQLFAHQSAMLDRMDRHLARQDEILARMDERTERIAAMIERIDARTERLDDRSRLQTTVLEQISDNQVRLADVLADIVNRLCQPPTANGH